MDELDLLARVRSDVPDLDRFTESRLRNRLLSGPVAGTAGAAGAAAGGRGRRRTGVRVAVAAAAVAALVGGGIALTGVRSDGIPIGATAAAAEVLDRAATAASHRAAPPAPGPDQVLYRRQIGGQAAGTTSDTISTDDPTHLCGSVHEMWMPTAEGADRTMTRTDGIVTRPGNADPATLPRDPGCEYSSFADNLGPVAEGSSEGPAELRALPTDPKELYEQIAGRSKGQGSNDAEGTLFNLVGLATSESPFLSPQQVAAIYRAMKYVPGVELLGNGKDLLGRPGVVIGRVEPVRGQRQEAIFDPDTGRMLGDREVVVDPDAGHATGGDAYRFPAGTVLWQSVITVQVVDRVGQRPTA
jgi:hypothetical protein